MTEQMTHDLGAVRMMDPVSIDDEEAFKFVLSIVAADGTFWSDDAFLQVNDGRFADSVLQPIHTPEDPIIIDEDHVAYLWRDTDAPEDPDLMVGAIFTLEPREDGSLKRVPCGIIAGDEFQGILQYRCPCCGDDKTGFSGMFFTMNDDKQIVATTRDVEFVTKDNQRRLFQNAPQGVLVSSYQIEHILTHHRNPGLGHDCGHDHSELPQRVSADKLALEK